MCNALLAGLTTGSATRRTAGIRFSYHPGDPRWRDDSGLLCGECWSTWVAALGEPKPRICAECGIAVTRTSSLHLRNTDTRESWQLCAPHAAELLNRLSTVEPKFDPATFRFPLAPNEKERSDD